LSSAGRGLSDDTNECREGSAFEVLRLKVRSHSRKKTQLGDLLRPETYDL